MIAIEGRLVMGMGVWELTVACRQHSASADSTPSDLARG
ncbi:hypothetical protein MIZ03_2385 [Rhodoferax lithotrophicus]|uniref:Uncharacterized protein n=1 Tax=Rhodoferax lithotrophicus TaxID=2798804 RepID=A0ABM7MMK1_9BURK|nr:hypothetical protein MIZ03_2385 [Rhodoferax sp. MIZ03]